MPAAAPTGRRLCFWSPCAGAAEGWWERVQPGAGRMQNLRVWAGNGLLRSIANGVALDYHPGFGMAYVRHPPQQRGSLEDLPPAVAGRLPRGEGL